MNTRADRERKAYDEDNVYDVSHKWHSRFRHVFECPNTLRHEHFFEEILRTHAKGNRVLDIGCGKGDTSRIIYAFGPRFVRGIDVSKSFIAEAKKQEEIGHLEFSLQDVASPMEGIYDFIVGRAILHHLDYRLVLRNLYEKNLSPGGTMVFMEPLGSSVLIRAYQAISKSAHTPDERSFKREDIRWLRKNFRDAMIVPFNWLSLPVGIVSTLVFSNADNFATRLADSVDTFAARHAPFMMLSFRQAILIIRKAD